MHRHHDIALTPPAANRQLPGGSEPGSRPTRASQGSDDTFLCPHCGRRYPRRPQLIDRKVRCSDCAGAFSLRAHGEAEPVSAARPAADPHGPPSTRSVTTSRDRHPTVDADALRERLAASMRAVADATAPSETTRVRKIKSDRLEARAERHRSETEMTRTPATMDVVLSGQGRALGAARRRMVLTALAILVAIVGLIAGVALRPHDPLRSTLAAYDQAFSDTPSFPQRHRALAAHFWSQEERTTYPGRIDDASLIRLEPIDVATAHTVASDLIAGHRYLEPLGAWVSPDHLDAARQVLHDFTIGAQVADLDSALASAGVDLLRPQAVVASMRDTGLDETGVHALSLLLRVGSDGAEDGDPERIDIARFHDPAAARLRVLHESYRVEATEAVSGLMARVQTAGSWTPWRILDVRSDDLYAQLLPPNPLLHAETVARRRLAVEQQRHGGLEAAVRTQSER